MYVCRYVCVYVCIVTPVRVHSLAVTEPSNPIDQFAVGVPRSESLQIRHASLDSLGFWHSALHEDQVTGVSADLSSGCISSNLHFNLRDIKRLSWTHTLVLRFAFSVWENIFILDSPFTAF